MTTRHEMKARLTAEDCDRSYDRRSLCQADVLAREVKCYGCGRMLKVTRCAGTNSYGDPFEMTLPRHKHRKETT